MRHLVPSVTSSHLNLPSQDKKFFDAHEAVKKIGVKADESKKNTNLVDKED